MLLSRLHRDELYVARHERRHICRVGEKTLNYSAVQPALLEDARQGGTKLIEAFAAGMWGGYGYAVQRKIMLLTKDDSCRDDLWEKEELLRSTFQPGTYFTNHFLILSKTPRQPLRDGGRADDDAGTVKLALKSITYSGVEGASTDPDPFGGVGGWLHRQYAKLLVESGADNCVQ
ncbi:unnamed protein product [Parascedosporium putredinis]|uniref:Uncharacterized protein n=1 Tax=Parascedosporium putredinis TaxID=1442378 RepID=A0A9P1M8A6_9PEZI|nr:unnamed protein product [Parascedosporium putredinis]CAI7989545.1 unnamed protein product [Parascedosporium putredinis]